MNGEAVRTGWIAVQTQIVGTPEDWRDSRTWSGKFEPTRARAIVRGFDEFGHDDFNVGHVVDGTLVWWGWMDEPLLEDLGSVASDLGFVAQREGGSADEQKGDA